MSTLKKQSFAAILTKHQVLLKPDVREFAKDLLTLLSDQHLSLDALLGKGLIPADNFDWQKITFTSNATPDTEDTVAHTLKRIPEGFIVINKDKAADVYDSGTPWTEDEIYLKTDVASAALTIYVF